MESPAAETFVSSAIGVAVLRWRSSDVALRTEGDADAVHEARAAIRTIRALLRILRSRIEPEWYARTTVELHVLARAMGDVRDADVALERLRLHSASLTPADRAGAEDLFVDLTETRERAYRRLRTIVGGEHYGSLLADCVPPLIAPDALVEPRRLMRRVWRSFEAAVEAAGDDHGELHRVRIRAKRVRATAEAVLPLLGAGARRRTAERFVRRLRELLDTLGTFHDASTEVARLRTVPAARPFVVGQLVALAAAEARDAYERWRPAYRRVADRGVRFWS